MSIDHRNHGNYRGFEIVTACEVRHCKGKAWAKEPGLSDLTFEGDSVEVVVTELKVTIDATLLPRTLEQLETLPLRHSEYLAKLGKTDKGLRKASLMESQRNSYCYYCGEPVDNNIDMVCVACKWIACHKCAACGCGYEKLGPAPNQEGGI